LNNRKMHPKLTIATLIIFILLVPIISASRLPSSGVIYFNGQILTMDDKNTVVNALYVRGDRIIAVGGDEEILLHKTIFTKIVDLRGKTMVPGFVDAHSHFPGTGLKVIMADLNSPPLGNIHNIKELKAALRQREEKSGKKKWVTGFGYDDTLLEEKRHPARADLDEVSTANPVWITHISMHLGVANSKALQLAGINENTEDPEGGHIRKDPETGLPNGVLEEKAMSFVTKLIPNPSFADAYKMLRYSTQEYLSHGVTTAQNGYAEKMYISLLSKVSKAGLLPLRLVMWPREKVGEEIVVGSFKPEKFQTKRFRVGAVKLIADGSIQAYTGYLTAPYYVPPSPDKPNYRGYPAMPREELTKKVIYFHKAGLQIAIHGNGDAAIDDILCAFEQAQKEHPRKDTRHIIVHAQMARDDQLDRMKALGVTPSFFSLHTYFWGDRHMNIFMGPERARRMSPAKSAVDRGLRFTIHTDSPVVPMDPLLLVWAAVNRISYNGTVIGAEQRITPLQALRAVTADAAWQMFLEDSRGSIEPGKFADLVILSANPLKDPMKIKDIKALETILGGKTAYKAD